MSSTRARARWAAVRVAAGAAAVLAAAVLAAVVFFASGAVFAAAAAVPGGAKPAVASSELEVAAMQAYNQAVRAGRAGDTAAAERLYRQALDGMPRLADAHLNLGTMLSQEPG